MGRNNDVNIQFWLDEGATESCPLWRDVYTGGEP